MDGTKYTLANYFLLAYPYGKPFICDVITGGATSSGCAGASVTVSGGTASVTIPANSAVAIDVNAKSGGGTPTTTPTTSPATSTPTTSPTTAPASNPATRT
jgi:alpha-amylase